jgi:hypothetical protein
MMSICSASVTVLDPMSYYSSYTRLRYTWEPRVMIVILDGKVRHKGAL